MKNYQEFLDTKEFTFNSVGIEVENIHEKLFDYQSDITKWALRKGRAAIFADCGMGKTMMQLEWANHVQKYTNKPVLLLAPLAVSSQTILEANEKLQLKVKYVINQDEVVNSLNITNYERLDNFDFTQFGGIVLDECFAPDTKIQVWRNNKLLELDIKDCKVGDSVLNCNGLDKITAIKTKKVNYAIRLKYNGKYIISSPRHPYFTQRGWVAAKELQENDVIIASDKAMRMVRGEFSNNLQRGYSEKILREILLSEMENEATPIFSEGSQSGSGKKTRTIKVDMAKDSRRSEGGGENSIIESNAQSRNQGESVIEIESDGSQTFSAWGKWSRNDIATAINEGCIVRQLDSGICYINGKTTAGLPDKLQSRFSELRNENCNRIGWSNSPQSEASRREEGCNVEFFRLESFEVLEQRCIELDKYRNEQGELYFYDLEIAQHPSFTINEGLVHNSSIIKSFSGKIRTQILTNCKNIQFRLACTATPSPNDIMELGNHAEFVGAMSREEMLSMFFVHDGGDTSKWRLKGHAKEAFWNWVCSWAVMISKPSDLGYSDVGFELPKIHYHQHVCQVDAPTLGYLFPLQATGLQERIKQRSATIDLRSKKAAEIVNNSDDSWLVWCDRNGESEYIAKNTKCINITGSDKAELKEKKLLGFASGEVHSITSKPKLAGFGMNWQRCHNMIFLGLSDSYESFYQAVRRCWRFGQKNEVHVHIVIAETEGNVLANIQRKEKDAIAMRDAMIANMADIQSAEIRSTKANKTIYNPSKKLTIPSFLGA